MMGKYNGLENLLVYKYTLFSMNATLLVGVRGFSHLSFHEKEYASDGDVVTGRSQPKLSLFHVTTQNRDFLLRIEFFLNWLKKSYSSCCLLQYHLGRELTVWENSLWWNPLHFTVVDGTDQLHFNRCAKSLQVAYYASKDSNEIKYEICSIKPKMNNLNSSTAIFAHHSQDIMYPQ